MLKLIQPEHIQLFDYWNEKRSERFAPKRSDIDPVDFPNLLPHICLYKVHRKPTRYEVVVMGTYIRDMWGAEFTGKFADEFMVGPIYERLIQHFHTVVNEKKPTVHEIDASYIDKDYIKFSRLMLPLSDDGESVDRLLLCIILDKKTILGAT